VAISIGSAGYTEGRRSLGLSAALFGMALVGLALLVAVALAILLLLLGSPWGLALIVSASVIAIALLWRDLKELPGAVRIGLKRAGDSAQGAQGESIVGRKLSELPDDFVIFHDLAFLSEDGPEPWNIDHVVVGPTGVFVVETKSFSGEEVKPAGRNEYTRKAVDQAKRNASTMKKRLKTWSGGKLDTWVEAIVLFSSDPHVDQLREGVVQVLPRRMLLKNILERRGRELDMEQIYNVSSVLFSQYEPGVRCLYTDEFDRVRSAKARWTAERLRLRDGLPPKEGDTCPGCHKGKLVHRTAKNGKWAGKSFLGCSTFPVCDYCDYKAKSPTDGQTPATRAPLATP
jgi:hypothetical protein